MAFHAKPSIIRNKYKLGIWVVNVKMASIELDPTSPLFRAPGSASRLEGKPYGPEANPYPRYFGAAAKYYGLEGFAGVSQELT
jgi:hypothetical protein